MAKKKLKVFMDETEVTHLVQEVRFLKGGKCAVNISFGEGVTSEEVSFIRYKLNSWANATEHEEA